MAEIGAEAGLPDGVLNVVPGMGPTAGAALARHMDVDKIAFTGSTEVGRQLLADAGASNLKAVQLECGGKAPHIVLADTPDIEATAQSVVRGIFFNQGEVCTAGSRLLVQASVRDELMARVLRLTEDMIPGDPLDPATRMGALVDRTHWENVLEHIERARREGGTLLFGGDAVRQESGGFYVSPTVFDDVRPDMGIAQEEVFGPVLATLTFDTLDEALALANGTVYGLNAAVWTTDLTTAHRMARALRCGMVVVNGFGGVNPATPFGGVKRSGFGRDNSLHALDNYTYYKTTTIHLR